MQVIEVTNKELYEDLLPDREMIYRFLGFRKTDPDLDTIRGVEDVIDELAGIMTPRAAFDYYPVTSASDHKITFAHMDIHSVAFARHVDRCDGIILLAATMGLAPDQCIRRSSVSAISRAVLYQSVSAAWLESFLDHICDIIRTEAEANGHSITSRFSPGYGDLPLSIGEDILIRLDASRRLGIHQTDSYLMVPSKSVTAFIGTTPHSIT